MYLVDSPSYIPVKIDASQTPPGATAPSATTKIAQLVAFDGDQVSNPGVLAAGQLSARWNIFSRPGTGSQASASRAAAAGVTHVGDTMAVSISQVTGTVGQGDVTITGGAVTFMDIFLMVAITLGLCTTFAQGPGLQFRAATGTAIAIGFGGGQAGCVESVSLSGYDQ